MGSLTPRKRTRKGSVIPTLAISVVGLYAFVALSVDLGMLAVSRNHSQNGADVAALAGCRTLNNKPGVVNNDLPLAVAKLKLALTDNVHLSESFVTSQIQKIEAGQFQYNSTDGQFSVVNWTDVTNNQGILPPSGGSWTAIRVTLAVTQPTYFMKVLGITSMPTGAIATAVYRPRDTAFVLDMTGSMAYSSTFNFNGNSLNPDDLVPAFGHYGAVQGNLIASVNQANGDGEAFSQNNYCITTPSGPPIVRNFYFDPVNVANPAVSAFPVTPGNLKNAFHRWSPPDDGGDMATYTPPVYTFAGYNALHTGAESTPMGPTPAPDTFKTMTDGGGITYVGDRWRRANGAINKTDTTWTGATNRGAECALDLLGYTLSGTTVRTSGGTNIAATATFRDLVWETHGYDLNLVTYRTAKGTGGPLDVTTWQTLVPAANQLVPAEDRFQGFSMGPGYWGKTFYVWPPDPRTPTGDPGVAGSVAGDWRRRFFLNRSGGAFDPQGDNNSSTSTTAEGISQVLLNGSSGQTTAGIGSTSAPNWRINYAAVLKWIKSGPMTLPPNLRAGRVLYYSSIPNDVTVSGTTQIDFDKVFWKNYIDYVLAWNNTSSAYLYGTADSLSGCPRSILTGALNTWTGPSTTWPSAKPYMSYADAPNRPRLHMWFGPLSLMDFLGKVSNWMPGTCYEAQCWQLKAGMSSVVDDLRNNRPNDYLGMVMFSADHHNGPRVSIGQNYQALKNALFYPKELLPAINSGNQTNEFRPYNIDFSSKGNEQIPNANGSTDPNSGLAYAFNVLSPSTLTSTADYGIKGRRGAGKLVIFETDGVPNTYRGLSNGTRTMNVTAKGYDTYYAQSTWSSGNLGNGNASAQSEAVKVVQQIVKPMAALGAASNLDSGLSLPNAPARVYPVAFGDLFDVDLAPSADFRPTALQFMANIAAAGNTETAAGGTSIPDLQIISGPYQQRIDRLKNCLERIFQAGVTVALVE